MPVWATQSVEHEPSIQFTRWCIVRVLDKPGNPRFGLHLCGRNDAGNEGRVSSRIMKIDQEKKVVRTRSGRIYELCGEPGNDGDAAYVLGVWLKAHDVKDFEFLTELPDGI